MEQREDICLPVSMGGAVRVHRRVGGDRYVQRTRMLA